MTSSSEGTGSLPSQANSAGTGSSIADLGDGVAFTDDDLQAVRRFLVVFVGSVVAVAILIATAAALGGLARQ